MQKQLNFYLEHVDEFPTLKRVCSPIYKSSTDIIGRDISEVHNALRNPEKSNVILLADPGNGKSTYVSAFAWDQSSSHYLTLSVATEQLVDKTAIDKDVAMQQGLTTLIDEVRAYSNKYNQLIVLFIDEFHRIVMTSPSAVEVMKPILEKSAIHGFRVIAATTFEEYDEWIAPNRALDQRFLRITLPELPKSAVLKILESRTKTHGVFDKTDPSIFSDIYDTSKQVLISNAQPRASLDILNTMIGYITKSEELVNGKLLRTFYTPSELNLKNDYIITREILNKVIQTTYGIDIDNNISVNDVRDALTSNLFNQEQAISIVMEFLEMLYAGFVDPTRARLSFLSTGLTGVGKALDDDTLVPVMRNNEITIIRHGDIKIGDKVMNRKNEWKNVIGVYPQGLKLVYRMIFENPLTKQEISVNSCSEHLWKIKGYNRTFTTYDLLVAIKLNNKVYVPFKNSKKWAKLKDIKVLDDYYKPMTCIMVDDKPHLYQLANGIVTHNTEMAKIISETMGLPLKRFDMSRYSRPEDAIAFADALAQAAWSAPNAYILIDEVEKSTKEAMNILLQVLDDARLTAANNPNRVISFTGNIINLTTNLGSEVYQHDARFGNVSNSIDTDLIYKALSDSNTFETAVLGRIDAIVPFASLPQNTMEYIAKRELDKNLDIVRTPKRGIQVSPDVIPYIIRDKTSQDGERGGARDAKRKVKSLAVQKIASYLATSTKEEPLCLYVTGKPRFKNKNIRDVDSGKIEMAICHEFDKIKWLLSEISKRTNKNYTFGECYVPNGISFNDFASMVVKNQPGAVYTEMIDDQLNVYTK